MSSSHIALPPPLIDGQLSLEAAIAQRCRVSPYVEEQLATQLILYTCGGDGVWRYHPLEHCLTRHLNQDVRGILSDAAQNRWFIGQAPIVLVISTSPRRVASDQHGQIQQLRYPPIEAGRAVERILLQAGALGLASVPVSEFDSERVRHALILSRQEEPMYLLPVGWLAQSD